MPYAPSPIDGRGFSNGAKVDLVSQAPADPEDVFPRAAWLFRCIAAAPAAGLTAAVVGPGGTGKSTLLNAVAAAYERAGERGGPLLVDDAHRLSSAELDDLRAQARADDTRIVVTYRPWPHPTGLSALGAQLSRHHSPVVLGLLDREGWQLCWHGVAIANRLTRLSRWCSSSPADRRCLPGW